MGIPLKKRKIDVPRDLSPITGINPAEVRPADAGLTDEARDGIWSATEDLYRTGLHPAVALCLRRQGQIVLDRAIGYSHGNGPGDPPGTPLVPATPDTPFCIFSASKAITAIVVHHLDDEGLLHIDDRVADYIPEFGRNGKERTTIRHILTHRAGIPSVAGHNDINLLLDWDHIVHLLCESKPVSVPGRRLAYHAITGGFVLGEVVRRVTGKSIREYFRDAALEPLGFRWMNYGVAAEDVPLVARNYFTGRDVPFPLSLLVKRALGVGFREAVDLSNDPRFLTGIVPSGNIVATAEEVSRFYQVLLNEGELNGTRVFDKRTIRRATTESSYLELDLTLALPVRYGLGLMLGGDLVSMFGPRTAQAYGHMGFIEVITWADPERQVAAGLLTTGKPFVGLHVYRLYRLLEAISRHCEPVR